MPNAFDIFGFGFGSGFPSPGAADAAAAAAAAVDAVVVVVVVVVPLLPLLVPPPPRPRLLLPPLLLEPAPVDIFQVVRGECTRAKRTGRGRDADFLVAACSDSRWKFKRFVVFIL